MANIANFITNIINFLNPFSEENVERLNNLIDSIGNAFTDIKNKFSFVNDVTEVVNDMVEVITDIEIAPTFKVNINSKFYTGELTILDLSFYAPFKSYGDTVICIFAYLSFLWHIFIRLPDIISGAGASGFADNMYNDIFTYKNTGFGRSNSYNNVQFTNFGLSKSRKK